MPLAKMAKQLEKDGNGVLLQLSATLKEVSE